VDRLAIFTSIMNSGTDTYVSLTDSERRTSSVRCLDQHITRRLSMAASRPSKNRKRPHQEEESDRDLHQPQWEEKEKTLKREREHASSGIRGMSAAEQAPKNGRGLR